MEGQRSEEEQEGSEEEDANSGGAQDMGYSKTNSDLRNAIDYSLHKLYAKNRMNCSRQGDVQSSKTGTKLKNDLVVSSLQRELAECTFAPKVSKHAQKVGRKYTMKTGGLQTSPLVVASNGEVVVACSNHHQ